MNNKSNNFNADKQQLAKRFNAWLVQNLQALISSLGQLWRKPLSSFLTTAVIGISLTLPAGFYVLLNNAETLTQSWDGSVQLTVFLKTEVSDTEGQVLAEKLKQDIAIKEILFVSRDEAMAEYRGLSGFSNALDLLDENPLPSLLLIRPEIDDPNSGDAEALLNRLQTMSEVDLAIMDRQWLKRLHLIIETIKRGVYIIAVLLALGVLLIVGNTIRLGILNNRQEIEITKLFGGTNAFIQRPFLYTGFWYGIIGSFIAWILISLSLLILEQPIGELAQLYSSNFQLIGLSFSEILLLMLSGSLLGLIGSWISVEQHIRAIEPC